MEQLQCQVQKLKSEVEHLKTEKARQNDVAKADTTKVREASPKKQQVEQPMS